MSRDGARTRWCKKHKDLDRFVFPQVLFDVLEGSLLALIRSGGTGLHGNPSRVLLGS